MFSLEKRGRPPGLHLLVENRSRVERARAQLDAAIREHDQALSVWAELGYDVELNPSDDWVDDHIDLYCARSDAEAALQNVARARQELADAIAKLEAGVDPTEIGWRDVLVAERRSRGIKKDSSRARTWKRYRGVQYHVRDEVSQ